MRTKIEGSQIRRNLFAFQTGFVTPPILATPVETFRPTSLLRYAAALAGSDNATYSALINADCDNGAALGGVSGVRGGDGDAAHCLGTHGTEDEMLACTLGHALN